MPAPPVHEIGPLIKQAEEAETLSSADIEPLAWLDAQPPESVLFICLGSGGTLSSERITELAWGLELSQQRFMWVVREPFRDTAAGKFFHAGGHENDPSTYLPEVPFCFRVAKFMASGGNKPHVAVLASPGLGHVTPFLEFSKRLVTDHGFRVSFIEIITTDPSPAQEKLIRSLALLPNLHIIGLPPVHAPDVVPENTPVVTQISLVVQESLKSLKAVLLGLNPPVKAVIIDLFCTDAFDICEQLSIPVYSFYTTSAAMLAFSLYLPELDRQVEGEFMDATEPIHVPGWRPVQPSDLPVPLKNRKIDDYKWFVLHTSRVRRAVKILSNTWEGLESNYLSTLRENRFFLQIPTPPIHPIGPLIKPAEETESLSPSDVKSLAWLDEQLPESVLFVCLGSGGTLTAEQLTELAWGLELSRQRFLWVVREPIQCSASGKYFTVGGHENDPSTYLPEGFLERTCGIGMVVPSWAPQALVLQHPSTGAFLSHCGWNSTLESVASGVPMIAWPMYAEQRMNASMLEEEVGVAMWPGREAEMVGREEVASAVRAMMVGEKGKSLRLRAKELKDSATEALSRGGTSSETLARISKEWM